MAKQANPAWKEEAIAAFLAGNLHRYYFEKMVEAGFMTRRTIEKDTPARGRNPVEYRLTDAGWKLAGQTPRDISVNTKRADSADEAPDPKPVPVKPEPAAPAPKPVPVKAERIEPAVAPVPVTMEAEPIPRLTSEELAAIESKPKVTKAERAAYFANVNWNVKFDRPETAGYDSSMPAFLDRRHPVWKKLHSAG